MMEKLWMGLLLKYSLIARLCCLFVGRFLFFSLFFFPFPFAFDVVACPIFYIFYFRLTLLLCFRSWLRNEMGWDKILIKDKLTYEAPKYLVGLRFPHFFHFFLLSFSTNYYFHAPLAYSCVMMTI